MLDITCSRIKVLDPLVANQIAAGEVIERPASIVKELLENSIDAKAQNIVVNIQRGGIQGISVTDDGSGIAVDDLELAVQQHATSKIQASEDLAAIHTLGFRGEALASIAAVSRLCIVSKTVDDEHAWQYKDKSITPAAHAVGTSIHANDIFYNLPARRKFLRSERTEFLHIEETFKRLALANWQLSFKLIHNSKVIYDLPAIATISKLPQRFATLCGTRSIKDAVQVAVEQNGLHLQGWIGVPQQANMQENNQYFFINNRVIRDRLINHAIRSAYQPWLPTGVVPFYCLFLTLDPHCVDVNVHPTKHEVRFQEARIMHTFLQSAVTDAISTVVAAGPTTTADTGIKLQGMSRVTATIAGTGEPKFATPRTDNIELLGILDKNFIIAKQQEKLVLIDYQQFYKELLIVNLIHSKNIESIKCNPQVIAVTSCVKANNIKELLHILHGMGFVVQQLGPEQVVVRAVPFVMLELEVDYAKIFNQLFSMVMHKLPAETAIVEIIQQNSVFPQLTPRQALKILSNNCGPKLCAFRVLSIEDLRKLI